MNRLKILMADDQPEEIEEARRALKEMAYDVTAVSTYAEAPKCVQEAPFDLAVIDLGWFTDDALKSQVGREDAGSAGWGILNLINEKNPKTVRILYSARANEPVIATTATEQGILCVKKEYKKESRLHLADIVKAIARELATENDLRKKVEDAGAEIQKSHARIAELEKALSETDTEKRKFNRILLVALLFPTVSFILFIGAYLLTQQLGIAILAFLGGAFLLLVILSAMKALTSSDMRYLGKLLQSLFPKA